jgi:limonene-1,2-epoxide hydrolase
VVDSGRARALTEETDMAIEAHETTAVVSGMLIALAERRIDDATAVLTPDIVWHNVSLPKIRGISTVSKVLRKMGDPPWGFEVVIHNIAGDGNVVLTERTDVLIWRRLRIEFWVCGTFELRDGKIAVWRDYFDNANFALAAVKGALRAIG